MSRTSVPCGYSLPTRTILSSGVRGRGYIIPRVLRNHSCPSWSDGPVIQRCRCRYAKQAPCRATRCNLLGMQHPRRLSHRSALAPSIPRDFQKGAARRHHLGSQRPQWQYPAAVGWDDRHISSPGLSPRMMASSACRFPGGTPCLPSAWCESEASSHLVTSGRRGQPGRPPSRVENEAVRAHHL